MERVCVGAESEGKRGGMICEVSKKKMKERTSSWTKGSAGREASRLGACWAAHHDAAGCTERPVDGAGVGAGGSAAGNA